MSRNPSKVRCTKLTKAGRPCRRWAVRGSEPPTCSSHRVAASQGDVVEQAGSSHRGAVSEGDALEQAGSSHRGAVSQGDALEQVSEGGGRASEDGFYSQMLSPDELADVVAYAAELTLADEIACTRVAVRRTLEFLSQGRGSLSESDYLRAAGLVFQGARTMARLLRDQQALLGDSTDRLTSIFDAALDGLSEEWGIEL